MLRYSDWIAECTQFLQTAPSATLSDKRLVAWVQLLKISEEIATGLSFDDLSKIAKIGEPGTRIILERFQKCLGEWRISLDPGVINGS